MARSVQSGGTLYKGVQDDVPHKVGGRKRPANVRDAGRGMQAAPVVVNLEVDASEEDTETEPEASEVEHKPRRVEADCFACQYGKPAVAGALAGAVLAYMGGFEVSRGVLYGTGAGLLYGAVRG